MTCGAAGGLNVALKAILDPGDEVIVFRPYFVEYVFYIKNSCGIPVFADTDPDTFQPDISALASVITARTKTIVINSPNNPTGVVYNEDILRDISALLKSKEKEYGTHITVLADEPYKDIVYDGVTVPDILKIFDDSASIYSYSKSLSVPGERIGYILSNPKMPGVSEFMDGTVFCNRILGFVNAPAFIQRVLLDSLESRIDPEIYKERRDMLYEGLTGCGFKCHRPEGAFYLFPRSPIDDEVEFVRNALKYNLLLVPGRGFGTSGYFRIAYCVNKGTIEGSIPQFRKLAHEYGLC
jgi:aspartate aminotransferase